MNTRKMIMRDTNTANGNVQFQQGPQSKSVIITIDSGGVYAVAVVEMKDFKRGADEMAL